MPRRGARASAMKCSADYLGGVDSFAEAAARLRSLRSLGADEEVCHYVSRASAYLNRETWRQKGELIYRHGTCRVFRGAGN